MNIRIVERRLRADHNLPDSFKFFKWKCMPDGGDTIYVEFKGGVCDTTYKSGPRKGHINYSKATDVRSFYVTMVDGDRYGREYEAETGNCRNCVGGGKTVASVDCVAGITTYRECRTCRGTGKVPTC